MYTIQKLSAMPYAQAEVRIGQDGSIYLKSYETIVAYITAGGWFGINGLYSMTTRKHIGAFVKEFAKLDFQTAKKLYVDGYIYNIYTGEVVEA